MEKTLAAELGLPTVAERMGDQEAIARERAQGDFRFRFTQHRASIEQASASISKHQQASASISKHQQASASIKQASASSQQASASNEGRREGGFARAANLSPERRREIARAGATARWDKRKKYALGFAPLQHD